MMREIGSQIYTNKKIPKNHLFLGGGAQKKKPQFSLEKNQFSNQQQYQEIYLFFWLAKFRNLTIFFRK
jgi:hypothetical protein